MSHIQDLPCKGPNTIYKICPQAKKHRSSVPLCTSRANKAFEMLHVDIWGLYRTTTYDGYKMFLSIIDNYSRANWVFSCLTKVMLSPCWNPSLHTLMFSLKLKFKSSGLIMAKSLEINMQ